METPVLFMLYDFVDTIQHINTFCPNAVYTLLFGVSLMEKMD